MTDTTPLTRRDLETQTEVLIESIRGLNQNLTRQIAGVARDVTTLKGDVADLKENMGLVQAALTEYLQTDRALHVLVEQLQARGLKLDAVAIFPQPQ
jgi:hypothetical protein